MRLSCVPSLFKCLFISGLHLQEDVAIAVKVLAESTEFCYSRKRITSAMYKMVFSEDYNAFTTEQVCTVITRGYSILWRVNNDAC